MEEQPSDEGELPPPTSETDEGGTSTGLPIDRSEPGPEAQALALEAEEIRRLVEAGAGTPDALRELAARLREHRAREEALWRAEVKPALVRENKGRLRGQGKPAPTKQESSTSNMLMLGLVLLGLVLVVVIAANTSVWLLVLPIVALVAWAWYQGRDSMP
ncbi:MAG: hypothetical protein ABIY48_07135 [Acidimicrobiales bacterium]